MAKNKSTNSKELKEKLNPINIKKPHIHPQEVKIYQNMTPAQKVSLIERYYRDAKSLKRAAIKSLHPDWTDDKVEQTIKKIFLYGTG